MFSDCLPVRPKPEYTGTWVRWSIRPTVACFGQSVRRVSPGISCRTHAGIGLKCCMLMDPDHLQKWIHYFHGLLNFLILALVCHSETGNIWGLRAFLAVRMEELAWNLYQCILTIFRTDQIMVMVCWCLLLLASIWLSETGQIWGFWEFSGIRMEKMAWNFARPCILTTIRTD